MRALGEAGLVNGTGCKCRSRMSVFDGDKYSSRLGPRSRSGGWSRSGLSNYCMSSGLEPPGCCFLGGTWFVLLLLSV